MHLSPIIAALGAAIVIGMASTGPAGAETESTVVSPAASCEATRSHYLEKLDRRPSPSFMKDRYRAAIHAAYQSCRENQANAWLRVERTLG